MGDEIRRVVKSVYGDDYDAAPVNSAEAGLAVAYDALIAPSLIGRGDPSRARCIVPYERHIEHHGSYGRPFPGVYKDLFADRGATAGELGLLGRRAENVDIVFARLAGASYDVHGIKSYVCPLLLHVDPERSQQVLERTATTHAADLAGFASLAYDTPGFRLWRRRIRMALRACSGISVNWRPFRCAVYRGQRLGHARSLAPTRARSAPM